MRALLLILVSSVVIGESYAGLIFHNIHNVSLLPKFYDHKVGRRNANYDNSPIVNIHNYQKVKQQESPPSSYDQNYNQQQQMYGFQPSEQGRGHRRGDFGTLSNYGQHLYAGEGGFVNTNIKGAGLKYGHHGGFGPTHNTMQQESYHHRYGSKFGQHHDPNIYGNTQIESSSSAASSASSSLTGTSSVSATSSSSSSSSVIHEDASYFNDRVKPWLY